MFAWHERPGAFERLQPPGARVRVLERQGTIHDGDRLVMEVPMGPIARRWVAVHEGFIPGRQFQDRQVEGPFAEWLHTHRMFPDGDGASILEDDIEYALPGGGLVNSLGGGAVERMLQSMFTWRHQRTHDDLTRHQRVADRGSLRIAITGASGMVGTALVPFLTTGGHRVESLVRRPPVPGRGEIYWNPDAGQLDPAALDGVDAVIHLAGENVGGGRWTADRKAHIRDSRAQGTALLARTLARLERKPRVLVSASAIGVYGDRGTEELDESSVPGSGFLADVCHVWEAATAPATAAGIRVVHARLGIVLASQGGALARMLPPFRAGAGGVVGSGTQVMSWVTLDDVVGALHHLLFADDLAGPVNVVAPEPVTNAEFTRELGRVLRRPTVLPLPAAAIRLAFGEMGESLLLGSACVRPRRLLASGFPFLQPALPAALRSVIAG